jgi:hypothetical protein
MPTLPLHKAVGVQHVLLQPLPPLQQLLGRSRGQLAPPLLCLLQHLLLVLAMLLLLLPHPHQPVVVLAAGPVASRAAGQPWRRATVQARRQQGLMRLLLPAALLPAALLALLLLRRVLAS